MTALNDEPKLTTPTEEIKAVLSPVRRAGTGGVAWARKHAVSLAVMIPVLIVVGIVHWKGSMHYPRYVDDPGTYLSQAWAVVREHRLSPYSYFYDHPPAGWIQIGLWAALTGGFGRYATAQQFGVECMLVAKLAATGLLYILARRLGLSRTAGLLGALLFGLTPLGIVYGRWTFLDNLVTPWLLAAFVFAYSPRRSIAAAVGGSASFAIAALTKETALVFLPAYAWALVRNLDQRNRSQALTVSIFTGGVILLLYPLYALYKGELFPGEGHTSLLGTTWWQLAGRESTGSLADASSPMRQLFESWLHLDMIVLIGGLVALLVAFLVPKLRPLGLVLVLAWLLMIRNGYVPFMHVIALLPVSALLIAAAVEAIAGTPALVGDGPLRVRLLGMWGIRGRQWAAALTGAALAVVMALTWTPQIRMMTGPHPTPPLRAALLWTVEHVPRDKVLVVHDTLWVDLVERYHYEPRPIIAHKLDGDPAVRGRLERIDYIIVPNWYFRTETREIPTLAEAVEHATPVASFGRGDDGVRVFKVATTWHP